MQTYHQKYYQDHKADLLAANKAWKQANQAKMVKYSRRNKLKRLFGITPEEYDAMLVAQGGVCAICKAPPGCRRLAVDHDHETGKVRALLCGNCNTGIGKAKESVEMLRAWIDYLQRFGK
jgi:hypothetical protein